MIFAEFLALIALLTGIGLSGKLVLEWIRSSDEKNRSERYLDATVQDDLCRALRSEDYRRLDDFLVTWADRVPKEIKKHIEHRRNELYIEADGRKAT